MKNPKKRPFAEDYNMSKITIENAGSTTDCTGLIPSAPLTEEEHAAYGEIKNFCPDDIAGITDKQG